MDKFDVTNQSLLLKLSRSIIAGTRKERVSQRHSNLKKCSISRSDYCHQTRSLNLLGSPINISGMGD